jgi:glycerophosphoryl diester phosphodiesterase
MRLPLSSAPLAEPSVPLRSLDRPLVVAHRGASAQAPENTLAAVRRAVALGVDMVEVDVQRTRDGALVLMHDASLVRTTDVRARFPRRSPWGVADLTLDELRTLDAGSWHSPLYAGERVPTLGEVLDLLEPTGVGLLLELKRPDLHPGVVDDLAVELVRRPRQLRAPRPAGLVVQSFNVPAMKELKTRLPQLPVGLLGRPAPDNLPALGSWADQVNPQHLRADGDYVEAVRQAGLDCLVWTVDRPRGMARALGLGVDGIISNRPDVLLRMVDEPALSAAVSSLRPDVP